ncbi:MAG: molybdopterin-dependent oxidoreductase, partial [Euryarchaeota archaeon]|nr:molybdopterin-dependent oxidoreductase [Euryarchaeota archaeon]
MVETKKFENSENNSQPITDFTLTRRDFIKLSAFAAGSIVAANSLVTRAQAQQLTPEEVYELSKPENILYSSCLQCNTGCPIKVKILDGVVAKIDGNPLSPWNRFPHMKYTTPIKDLATIDAGLCPKGQSGIQTYYDPYRIRKVLKRAGKRGENKWVSIPFEQAIEEIVMGGLLFKNVPGEENRYVEGLKDVIVLRDPKVSKEMKSEIDNIWHEKDAAKKKELVNAFKEKFRYELGKLIDPEHPDLGPKNNQFVFMWGRMKGGRSDIVKRFVAGACGSYNYHGHTTVCQGSLYFTGKAMSEQYLYDAGEKKYKWTGGDKFYFQADEGNAEFIIFVGAGLFEGNYGPTNRAMKIMEGVESGRLKFAILDPRFSKLAAKAWKWISTKVGTDAAFAYGMIRWILENKKYDENYLKNANKKAAADAKEPTFTNAVWLVKIKDGKPEKFLYGSEIGLSKIKKKEGTEEVEMDPSVVLKDGSPVAVDPYDEVTGVTGDLFVDTEVGGIKVKSALQLVKEEAFKRSIKEWAELCGAKEEDIIELAREFTNHGKKAAVDVHRGVSQHTNGFYNVGSWFLLNLLIGNYSWLGGVVQLTTYSG